MYSGEKNMLLQEIIDEFLRSRRGKAPNTLIWYEQQFRAWLEWLTLVNIISTDDVDWLLPETVEDYLDHERDRELSDSTISARYRSLAALFNWIHKRRRKWLDGHDTPTSLIDPPSPGAHMPRVADIDDVHRLIQSMYLDGWMDYRDRLVVQTMLSTGLRVDEVINLRVDNVDLRDNFVFVESGKGDKPRIVPFDANFRLSFVAYLMNRPGATTTKLLLSTDSSHKGHDIGMTTDSVRHMLRRRCQAANVRYINPHSIRHLFATKALNDGIKLSAVSAMLGHSSPSFTAKVYAKWVKSGLRREYDENWT